MMSGLPACQRFGWIVCAAVLVIGAGLPAVGQPLPSAPQATPSAAAAPATQPEEAASSPSGTPVGQPTEYAGGPASQPAEPSGSKTPRRPFKDWFHLGFLDGDLQLESQYDWQQVKFPVKDVYSPTGTQRQTDKVWQLTETLGLQAAGDIVDPKWFTYNMALRLGLDETIARESSPFDASHLNYSQNGWLTQYNFNFGLLQGSPIHFDVYASQDLGRIDRLFLPALWHQSWRNGVTMIREDEKFPMELTLEQTRDIYSGDIDQYDDEDVRDTMLRYGGTIHFTPYHQLRLDYQLDDRHERYPGTKTTFKTTQNVLRLDDQVQFGSRHQHLWETNVEYEQDSGDLPRDHIYVGSRLALKHSDKLSTEYKYEYSRESYEGLDLDSNRFDWIGTWRPSSWLTTTSDLFAAHDSSDEGLSDNLFGADFRASAVKDNRYGTLSGTAGYHYDYADTDFGDRTGTQINETITFRNSQPIFLAHSDVVADSILVTNLNRTEIYFLGKDYIVINSRQYAAIVRMPFGRIIEGQAVRVNYRYRTIRNGRFQTHQFDARIQQDFKSGWTPYYEVMVRRQSVDTSDNFFYQPNDADHQRVGVTYHRKTWLVGGEAEFADETVDPYDALHFNGNWTILERLLDRLAVRGSISQFWYRDLEHRRPTVYDLAADYRRSLSKRMDFTTTAIYRYEHDSVIGETNGVDAKAGLAWQMGQLTLTVDLEYDLLDITDYQENGLSLWIRVRRDFPNLLGKRP